MEHHDKHPERKRGGKVHKREDGGMVDERQETPERKRGGSILGPESGNDSTAGAEVYAGKGSKVLEKAEKRKRGGSVHKKHPMHVEGGKARHGRLDRPGRKRGGGVGADTSPMTAASKLTPAEGQRAGFKIGKEDD